MSELFTWITDSNWESFVPDLIVGLATGLAVGVVLLIVQKRGERLANERELQRQWDAVKPQLAPLFREGGVDQAGGFGGLHAPTISTTSIEKILRDKPTSIWAHSLRTEELRMIDAFYQSWNRINYAAGVLDARLYREVAALYLDGLGNLQMLTAEGSAQLHYLTWTVAGVTSYRGGARPAIEEDYGFTGSVLADPDIAKLASAYRADTRLLVKAHDYLVTAFARPYGAADDLASNL